MKLRGEKKIQRLSYLKSYDNFPTQTQISSHRFKPFLLILKIVQNGKLIFILKAYAIIHKFSNISRNLRKVTQASKRK